MSATSAEPAADPDAHVARSSTTARCDQLVAELVELRSVVNAADARCAQITAELTVLSDGHPLGCRSVTQFLSWQAGLSAGAARALITVGERLAELAPLEQAATAGEVSVWQARAIASAAADDGEASGLLEIARHGTCAQLETACRHIVRSRAAGDDADAAAHRARRLRAWWTTHGTLRLDGELGTDAAAILRTALDQAAQTVPADAVEGADDDHAARQADALEILARAFLDGNDASSGANPPPGHLAVHIGLDRLLDPDTRGGDRDGRGAPADETGDEPPGGADPGGRPTARPDHEPTCTDRVDPVDEPTGGDRALWELRRLGWNGPGVGDALVRRLCCDAEIQAVICNPDGNPLALGRRHRLVDRRLRRALFARDGARCAAPGCDAARFLHAHHIVHWTDGGATDLDNLVLLCHWHHRLVHDGALTITTTHGRPHVHPSRPDPAPRPPPVDDITAATRTAGITASPAAARNRWSGDDIDWACFDAAYLGRPPPDRDLD